MKRAAIGLALSLISCSALANQFCAVTSGGANCIFVSLDACYQAIRGMGGGQCVVNPQVLPQPIAPTPIPSPAPVRAWEPPQQRSASFSEAWERGGEAGRRQRQEREEHEARMALLKAQTEAAQLQTAPTSSPKKPFDWDGLTKSVEAAQGRRAVVYSCEGQQTTYPSVGCVVIGFGDQL